MTTQIQWTAEVGRAWAAEAARTDRSFAGLTKVLLERIAACPGRVVLDIGCGAGELALAIAATRADAAVVGVDISVDLVTVATERGAAQANARFVTGDAAGWHEPGFAPDLLVSRHGVMFFDAPVAAFAALHASAAPGAAMVFSCFRAEAENPWASDLAKLVAWPDQPESEAGGEPSPGPFAFADRERVARILAEAGWHDVDFEPVDYAYIVGEGPDPEADAMAFLARIGPAARALRLLDEADRARIRERMEAWLSANGSAGGISFPAAAWIVRARG